MEKRALWAALLFLLAGAPGVAVSPPAPQTLVPWVFRADFAHGLTGWMSFPLAQDIGFDPSLYTAQQGHETVLVREVQPLGRKRLLLGVIRPLDFFAGPETRIRIEYALSVSGRIVKMEVILAGAHGHRYSATLPRQQGNYAVELTGNELQLPAGETGIQAVVLLGTVEQPPPHAKEQLTVAQFILDAERRPQVAVVSPGLVGSEVGPAIVSRQVLGLDSSLKLQIQQSQAAASVELDDPTGKRVQDIPAPASGNPLISVPLGSHPVPGLWTAKVRSGPAQTVFNFLVLGPAPPHPRILLRERRLEQLRRLPQYAGLREQIHRQAQKLAGAIAYNAAAGNNIAHLPSGTGLHPGFVGELKAYFKLLEAYANAISYNALDYSLNGNEAAFALTRRTLLTVARWQTWTPPRFTSHGLHTYYEVGVFAQRVALGYDLIAPRLRPEEKKEVADAFWKQILEPTVSEYFLYNRLPLAASNWMANSLGGAIAAAVAVEGDTPEWKAHEGVALAELVAAYEQLLKGLFPGDGSEAEPAGYENFAMEGLSWGSAALDALGVRPLGTARMWEGFWWPYYAMVKTGLVLDTGDFDGRLEKLTGFAWGAEHAGIPALRDFYDRSKTYLDFSAESGVQHTGRELEQASGPLDLACCSEPPASYQPPPPSRIFPERGSAVLRSGWDARATVISMRVGPWFNHEHHDEGSFQAAAFGEKLISEAGYSGYYDDPNYPIYFTQAPGHNTVLLDGDPFSQMAFNGRFWTAFDQHPHFADHLLSSAFDYLAADLTSAYAGQLAHYERDFVFIKPDFLVVRDRIHSQNAHVYTWLLHTPAGAELSTAGARAVIQMPGAVATLLAVGRASDWKTQSTPISITKFDDLDHGVIHTPREFYLESERGPAADFLVGLHFEPGAASGAKTALRALQSSAGEGIIGSGAAPLGVVFRTRPGALQLETFSTDGSILAVRGGGVAQSLLAVGAREVRNGSREEFRSKAAVDVAWQRSEAGVQMSITSPSETDIEISTAGSPAAVRVDGVSLPLTFRNGMTTIRGLGKGEHRVEIGY